MFSFCYYRKNMLIQIKQNKGVIAEPWGAMQYTTSLPELIMWILAYSFLFWKLDKNHLLAILLLHCNAILISR